MKQLGDQLTLDLATTWLFDSGEATLKPGGTDVLHRVGGVLKQYPHRVIHVFGHTDNVPIKGRLANQFTTNVELSQARAASARQALTEGGMAADQSRLRDMPTAAPLPATPRPKDDKRIGALKSWSATKDSGRLLASSPRTR